MSKKFTVGQRLWLCDTNRRVYRKDPVTGRSTGGPIFEEHFVPYEVAGVEPRSYLISQLFNGSCDIHSIPERIGTAKAESTYYTDAEREDSIFVNDHRYKIAETVHRCDAAMLRRVAETIGYQAGGVKP